MPNFTDPLFSIFIIFLIGFFVALSAYFWEFYKKQKEHNSLLFFLEKFESNECSLDTKNLKYESNMLTPLSLLAKAFEKSGEYHRAISIYLFLIKNIPDELPKYELMEYLGNTYLNAGFLGRAESIYLDILSRHPRNKSVLYSLGVVYEMTHNFTSAKETLVPLETLGEDITKLKSFFEFESLIYDKQISKNEKIKVLVKLYKQYPNLYRLVINQLFKLDPAQAWKIYDHNKSVDIIDILWFLDKEKIDFNKIKNDDIAKEILFIKGYSDEIPVFSNRLNLNMLNLAKQSSYDKATLVFSYICSDCRVAFPTSFKRCPNCKAVNSIKVEDELGKTMQKSDNSLL
ncbi:conserved hypothetical protein [Sulfurovum sp. enrichment culture clone C5]|uniref:Uncharacterized protein n=1 Tax=Sulfurovum sp. enrichment culture clone C5 TaxID=497650 RepID=A0A0S4XRG8_9BACT|nr:conserved hypothetical protein [Sulfurovum sp. enrichment culture clone C5]